MLPLVVALGLGAAIPGSPEESIVIASIQRGYARVRGRVVGVGILISVSFGVSGLSMSSPEPAADEGNGRVLAQIGFLTGRFGTSFDAPFVHPDMLAVSESMECLVGGSVDFLLTLAMWKIQAARVFLGEKVVGRGGRKVREGLLAEVGWRS